MLSQEGDSVAQAQQPCHSSFGLVFIHWKQAQNSISRFWGILNVHSTKSSLAVWDPALNQIKNSLGWEVFFLSCTAKKNAYTNGRSNSWVEIELSWNAFKNHLKLSRKKNVSTYLHYVHLELSIFKSSLSEKESLLPSPYFLLLGSFPRLDRRVCRISHFDATCVS